MENKVCTKCGKEKPLEEFSRDNRTTDGFVCHCKECIKDYKHQWYNNNKEIKKEHDKEVRQLYKTINKDKIKQQSKEYHKKNKDKSKSYYQTNKDHIKLRQKQYRKDNWKLIRQREKDAQIKKRQNPLYKLKDSVRNRIRTAIKSKGYLKHNKTLHILGCSFEEFKNYIESKFESWMTWNNHGNPKDKILEPNKTWDIDHVIPISTAKTEEDVIKLNHYTNLQPLCSYFNRFIKRDN